MNIEKIYSMYMNKEIHKTYNKTLLLNDRNNLNSVLTEQRKDKFVLNRIHQ